MIIMMNLLTMMTIVIGPGSDKKNKSYFCAFPWNGFLAFIYWRSGFAPPSPSMLILPLYLNLRSKEISPEHISFPYIYSWKKWLENLYFYKEQFHVIVNNRDTFLLYEHTICRAIIFWVLWALHWENHFPHRKWQVCEVSYNGRLWYKFSCFVGTQGQ